MIVLDRATYQTVLEEEDKHPVNSCNKLQLVEVIKQWRGVLGNWPLTWVLTRSKHQLLYYERHIYPATKYKIQKAADKFSAEEFSIKILFLPFAHPEHKPCNCLGTC